MQTDLNELYYSEWVRSKDNIIQIIKIKLHSVNKSWFCESEGDPKQSPPHSQDAMWIVALGGVNMATLKTATMISFGSFYLLTFSKT